MILSAATSSRPDASSPGPPSAAGRAWPRLAIGILCVSGLLCGGVSCDGGTEADVTGLKTRRAAPGGADTGVEFDSKAELRGAIRELPGSKAEDVDELLGAGGQGGIMLVPTSPESMAEAMGTTSQEKTQQLLREATKSHTRLYTVKSPRRGTIVVEVQEGVVTEASFEPQEDAKGAGQEE